MSSRKKASEELVDAGVDAAAQQVPVKVLVAHRVLEAHTCSFKRRVVSFEAGGLLKLKHYSLQDVRLLREAGLKLVEVYSTQE